MIEFCEAKRFIAAVPWPEGTRPLLALMHGPIGGTQGKTGHTARLYRPEPRFHGRAVQVTGPTPEGALRWALSRWVREHNLPPELAARFGDLAN
jgi:hypothetical protein